MAQQQKFDIALPRPRKPVVLPPPPIKNDNHIININIDGKGGGSSSDLVILSSLQALSDKLADLNETVIVMQTAQNSLTDGQKQDVLDLIAEHVTEADDLINLNNSIIYDNLNFDNDF